MFRRILEVLTSTRRNNSWSFGFKMMSTESKQLKLLEFLQDEGWRAKSLKVESLMPRAYGGLARHLLVSSCSLTDSLSGKRAARYARLCWFTTMGVELNKRGTTHNGHWRIKTDFNGQMGLQCVPYLSVAFSSGLWMKKRVVRRSWALVLTVDRK